MASSNAQLADDVVSRSGKRLVGRTCRLATQRTVRIASVFHYGAVDIDPKHLVVWVLLAGADESTVPEWWSPEAAAPDSPPELVEWVRAVAAEIRTAFVNAEWPNGADVTVLFESTERVERLGGWNYFR